jgi:hypothetical protein
MQRLAEFNETKKLAKRNPTHPDIKSWIEQVKQMPRKILY